ncbi:MAG: ATPase, T2SS/T4P/T4SS family [bacterium]|nr:ATPase, T2SS/T4P/T4SS family [bacterium]
MKMDVNYAAERYDQAAGFTPDRIKTLLLNLPISEKAQVSEIRLRVNRPITVTYANRQKQIEAQRQPTVSLFEIENFYNRLCGYSVYAHQNELRNGYITVCGGHRAGICGTAVYDEGDITSFKNISSVNLRIARQIKGAADIIAAFADKGMIIAGPPACGKTTVLRDAVRQISNNNTRVVLIDTRGEIASSVDAVPTNDVGMNTDVLTGISKNDGIEIAIRTLNPQVIAFDEITSKREVELIEYGLYCGVNFVCTIHIGEVSQIKYTDAVDRLLNSGAIQYFVYYKSVGSLPRVYRVFLTSSGYKLSEMRG